MNNADTTLSKEESKEIKSILDQVKEMENNKLQSQVKNLAEKIKEFSDNKK